MNYYEIKNSYPEKAQCTRNTTKCQNILRLEQHYKDTVTQSDKADKDSTEQALDLPGALSHVQNALN